ncbi:AfsR/SARP family transcriptional regulator [Streptomyces zagrosensis]|uniref:DNA-binding SARP family transcriptional activator n=1 Tax=Streptomyces zagrosensis TaxID=1042984 RepID=A0A7W9QBB1_9ACTN|nr:AfsR/SARP family transcriptional regulator [Streptomyces zagrosensis]MBB5937025.1 DNA-binding SARP family transcriptional activator [Streptomyces zagrosensis]
MRYELLGLIRVVGPEDTSYITAHKAEVLLATLLARAGQVVSADQLINELWGDRTPRRAHAALHVYVSQLRKFLRDAGGGQSIVTRPLGYLLRLGSDELDSLDFQRLMDDGRQQVRLGRHEQALERFESALALWRGPAFDDARDGPIVNTCATWLEETRLQCLELLIEEYLTLGRHRDIVGQLYALISDHPLRETFYRHLMLALYRSERQAEALMVYRAACGRLSEELGLAPCRPLRDLHQAILSGDDQFSERPS